MADRRIQRRAEGEETKEKNEPDPRFKEFIEAEDHSGFTIPGSEHFFKYDKWGGWQDETGKHYSRDGVKLAEPMKVSKWKRWIKKGQVPVYEYMLLNGPQDVPVSEVLKKVLAQQGIKVDSVHIDYTLNISDPESASKMAELYGKENPEVTFKPGDKLDLSLSFDDSESDENLGGSDIEGNENDIEEDDDEGEF
jgi:hypothetical protein